MSEDDNVINLADRRPVQEPPTFYHETSIVKPVEDGNLMTKVSSEVWNSFSPETKSDALTHDLVSATMLALEQIGVAIGKEVTDEEIMDLYASVSVITDRFFDVTKEIPDGE